MLAESGDLASRIPNPERVLPAIGFKPGWSYACALPHGMSAQELN